jgi:hypothetical protein
MNAIIAIEITVATANEIRKNIVMQVYNKHLCFMNPSKRQQTIFYSAISSSSFCNS